MAMPKCKATVTLCERITPRPARSGKKSPADIQRPNIIPPSRPEKPPTTMARPQLNAGWSAWLRRPRETPRQVLPASRGRRGRPPTPGSVPARLRTCSQCGRNRKTNGRDLREPRSKEKCKTESPDETGPRACGSFRKEQSEDQPE